MMRTRAAHAISVSLLLPFVLSLCGCPLGGGRSGSGGAGFWVYTDNVITIGGERIPDGPASYVPVSGIWVQDLGTATGDTTPWTVNTGEDGAIFISDGRFPALWHSLVTWPTYCGPNSLHTDESDFYVTVEEPFIAWDCLNPPSIFEEEFSLIGSLPLTATVQIAGFADSSAMPRMYVYDTYSNLIGNYTASSMAGDGSSATFPFPSTNSLGYPISSGVYSFNAGNADSSGDYTQLGNGFFSIGTVDTSKTTPYGVTAFDGTAWTSSCMSDSWYGTYCGGGQSSRPDYAVTLASPGQVCFEGTCTSVGSEPTDLKTWGSGNGETYYEDDGCNDVGSGEIQCSWQQSGWTGPAYAITTDYASNTATIVDLVSGSVAATIPVGTNPMAVVLDSNQQNAYVANYGSGTISQINLAGYYVANTIYVGANPAALSLDPSGNSLWVGESNNMANVNLTTFAVTNYWLEGQATSVAISLAQNSWICTTISNDQSTFVAEDASLSNSWNYNDDVTMPISGTSYAGSGTGTTPPPYLKASAGVTATSGNGIAVTSTPTGFAVIDLVAHKIIMQGTTPTPVRGIATDAAQGIAYLTLPESNSIITVPLPVPD